MQTESERRSSKRRRLLALLITNFKHFSVTFLLLLVAVVCFGLSIGAEAHFFEDRLAYRLDGETHVFFENGSLIGKTLRGNSNDGYYVETQALDPNGKSEIEILFPADGSVFTVNPYANVSVPEAIYETDQPILAISDVEGGFGAFRDFLVAHGVADNKLNWTFGKGHLVLVGDFVDRGASTTQVLWAIYKLEQSARQQGGVVHYIIGNHEIKNLQGNFQAAEDKYFYIAGMLGRQQFQLYGEDSLIGRWLASKNVLETINGVAFVHGGLHPEIVEHDFSVPQINQIVRSGYRQLYFTPTVNTPESFLRSSTTGPAWYRGYFKEDLTQAQVEGALATIGAKAVVVGHTLQGKVNARFDRSVFAIDVPHPKDYLSSFPFRSSEGLLIENGEYFRLRQNGERQLL